MGLAAAIIPCFIVTLAYGAPAEPRAQRATKVDWVKFKGCLHPGKIDYAQVVPPYAGSSGPRFLCGQVVGYTCDEGYVPSSDTKMICLDPTGWSPATPPRCRINYHKENDGTRKIEDPFWVSRLC